MAELRDVSVTGVKVFLRAEDLDLPSPPDLLEAAMAVKSALPDTFTVRLGYEDDSEIERLATMARLVLPSYEPGCIELGCMFTEALTPDEVTELCGSSPTLGQSDRRSVPRVEHASPDAQDEPEDAFAADQPEAEGSPEEADAAPAAPAAKPARKRDPKGKTHRVFLTSEGEETQLLCHTVAIDLQGLHVRAKDTAVGAEDAAEAALLFARRYGTDVFIKIMDGVKHLWSGPAEVLGMEILFDRPGDLLLTVAFGRGLRPAEIERLKVA